MKLSDFYGNETIFFAAVPNARIKGDLKGTFVNLLNNFDNLVPVLSYTETEIAALKEVFAVDGGIEKLAEKLAVIVTEKAKQPTPTETALGLETAATGVDVLYKNMLLILGSEDNKKSGVERAYNYLVDERAKNFERMLRRYSRLRKYTKITVSKWLGNLYDQARIDFMQHKKTSVAADTGIAEEIEDLRKENDPDNIYILDGIEELTDHENAAAYFTSYEKYRDDSEITKVYKILADEYPFDDSSLLAAYIKLHKNILGGLAENIDTLFTTLKSYQDVLADVQNITHTPKPNSEETIKVLQSLPVFDYDYKNDFEYCSNVTKMLEYIDYRYLPKKLRDLWDEFTELFGMDLYRYFKTYPIFEEMRQNDDNPDIVKFEQHIGTLEYVINEYENDTHLDEFFNILRTEYPKIAATHLYNKSL